jgi:hypothetical protein
MPLTRSVNAPWFQPLYPGFKFCLQRVNLYCYIAAYLASRGIRSLADSDSSMRRDEESMLTNPTYTGDGNHDRGLRALVEACSAGRAALVRTLLAAGVSRNGIGAMSADKRHGRASDDGGVYVTEGHIPAAFTPLHFAAGSGLVGLYRVNAFYPQLESAWFQPLSL